MYPVSAPEVSGIAQFYYHPQSFSVTDMTTGAHLDYRVHLDVYDGPLDLLLYLIRRDELDIFNIPISRITGSYLQFLENTIPQSRQRKAIFYRNGDVYQVYAYRSRTLITDLRHEVTHAILHQHLPFLPLWIDEGLAEYLEEPEFSRSDSSRTKSARWKARIGWSPSLQALENIPNAESMDADDYRDSWAMTCMLLNESDTSLQALRDYLAVIHQGEAPGLFSKFQKTADSAVFSRANSYFRKMPIRLSLDSSR